MCEKPIAIDIATTKQVVEAARAKPELKFLVPFCRRCELICRMSYPFRLVTNDMRS